MKTFIILMALVAAGSVREQIGPVDQQFNTVAPKYAEQTDLFTPVSKPNEIAGPRPDITYSGIVPEVIKADNPLELINPFAPSEYGSGGQNLSLDITVRHAPGLKLFSIDF